MECVSILNTNLCLENPATKCTKIFMVIIMDFISEYYANNI